MVHAKRRAGEMAALHSELQEARDAVKQEVLLSVHHCSHIEQSLQLTHVAAWQAREKLNLEHHLKEKAEEARLAKVHLDAAQDEARVMETLLQQMWQNVDAEPPGSSIPIQPSLRESLVMDGCLQGARWWIAW